MKVSLIDTVIHLEDLLSAAQAGAQTGAALELGIKCIDYFDDMASA